MADEPQYDAVGDLYRQYKTTATAPIPELRLFLDLVGDIRGQRVLDLATGYGAYARYAHGLGASEVVGVDVSPEMVGHAEAATESPAIVYRTADARDLPDLGTFDTVTAVWLFNYAESPEELAAMLAGARRALRPGGRLVAVTVNPRYDVRGPDWTRYGLTVHAADPDTRRHRLRIALLAPGAEIPLSMSRWDASVYADALAQVGLGDPEWALPTVPADELAQREAGYWDTALTNPFPAGFTAVRDGF
ncbi:class I SAM-dependent methyltransferase [Streptomyces sp. NA04227]|uniref:class I SAM-dependent methyltransferase n=1 Tax=Streptomyces sp. NA04227 TaxID=2742136 RepID=UPI0015912E88|nr:class I SAM-dependent methyltransferase [Streptomyces sp. NA04227]QKW07776.1 class I SAM-dependent methyltransferase [Streptomyces sp. NA04227]